MPWSATLKWIIQHLDDTDANLVELSWTISEETIIQVTANGNNVLHYAGLCKSPAVTIFMAKVAPYSYINAQNSEGETPLHWACRAGNEDVVRALMICGADPKITDFHRNTVLHFAIETGNEQIVKLLVQNKCCELETRNSRGLTPLAAACEEYEYPIITYLLLQGASSADLLQYYAKQNKKHLCKFIKKFHSSQAMPQSPKSIPSHPRAMLPTEVLTQGGI